MKPLLSIGIALMVGGSLLAIYGYELCAHYFCLGPHCPICEISEPISPLTIYTGIAIVLGGAGFLGYSFRKLVHVTL